MGKRTPLERAIPLIAAAFGTALPVTGVTAGIRMDLRGFEQRIERPYEEGVHKETVSVDGREVTLLGVSHTQATFEAYEEQFREEVRNADAVVLEYFGATEQSLASAQDKEGALEQMLFDAHQFFSSFGSLASEEGKDIIVVNPETALKHLALFFVLLGLPAGIVGETLGRIAARERTLGRHKPGLPWQYLLLAPAAAAWSMALLSAEERSRVAAELGIPGSGPDMVFMMEHRDQVTARGIPAFLERNPEIKKLLVVQGSSHQLVAEYLSVDPSNTDVVGAVFPETMGVRYSFNREKGEWEVADEFPIAKAE